MQLRDYQHRCVESIQAAFGRHRSVAAVSPTGTGKAVKMAHLACRWLAGKVLILAHRRKLLTQAMDKVRKTSDRRVELECGEDRLTQWEVKRADVVVASKDSLHERRIGKFDPADFGLVLIDECHHASRTSKTYNRVFRHFGENPGCRFAGFTATIDRSDKSLLIGPGRAFEACAFEYPLWSCRGEPNAIEDGWIVPLRQEFVEVEGLDFSHLKAVGGDWTDKQLESVIAQEKMLHAMAAPLVDIVGNRPTIVFCATKAHAAGCERDGVWNPGMVQVINRYRPDAAAAILGETPDDVREEMYARFRAGRLQYLVGCDVMTEGLDLPETGAIAICRPTKSRNRYAQMAGRATRPLEEIVLALNAAASAQDRRGLIAASCKADGLIVDFVGVGNLRLAVSVADILAQDEGEAALMQRAFGKASKRGDTSADGLRKAMGEVDTEVRAEKWQQACEGVLAEIRGREKIVARAAYRTEAVDPLTGYQTYAPRQVEIIRPLATERQVKFLIGLGVSPEKAERYSKGQAGVVIDKLSSARCTERQANALRKRGIDPSGHNVKSAGEMLDRMSAT